MFDERGTKGERRRVPPLAAKGEPVADRIAEIEARVAAVPCDDPYWVSTVDMLRHEEALCANAPADLRYLLDELAKARAALDAATRERDDLLLALEQTRSDMSADLYAATRERDEAWVALEKLAAIYEADIDPGDPPAGRPTWLRAPLDRYQQAIERGEHTKEQT